MALNNLGLLAAAQGDRVTARQHYEESLAMHREIGDPTDIAQTLINLGELAIQVGDLEHGKKYLAEGLALRRLLEDRVGVGHALKVYAAAALAQKDLVRAVVLFAAAERLLTEAGVKAPTSGQETDAQNLKGLRSRLDSTAFDIAWREGTALSWEDAARLALGEN